MIAIDKSIPLPTDESKHSSKRIYPFPTMEIGDSFFAPGKKPVDLNGVVQRHKAKGKDFTSRAVTENGVTGCRVWRTK